MVTNMWLLTAFVTLFASLVVAQEYTDHQVRSIRSTSGMDLAECTCRCCSDVSSVPEVPCPVEVVILLNSAACVKAYWPKMKVRTTAMIEDLFAEHQGRVRVGVIAYSTEAVVVSSFKDASQKRGLLGAVSNAQYMGHGDYIAKGLDSALGMFKNLGNGNENTRRVLMVMTNSGVVEKTSLAAVQKASLNLRQNKVDIMVNTITPECTEQKACLSCCPDFNFLQRYITTRDRICAEDKDNNYSTCLSKINYQCAGKAPAQKCRSRACECECKQKKGPMGPMGPPGIPGAAGVPGRQGQPGSNGRSGMDGASGSPGNAGSNGEDGLSSSDVAPNGRQGQTGSVGSSGSRGAPGPAGPDGSACGPVGEPGSRGVAGPDGAHGNPGENGQPGQRGAAGQRGASGKKGLNGPAGAPGNPGMNGRPGNCGAKGSSGQPGARGKSGLVGDAGARGANGAAGARGQNGPRGVSGVNGRQGMPGPDGEMGSRGRSGPPACAISLNSYQHIIREEITRKLASYQHVFRCNNNNGRENRNF